MALDRSEQRGVSIDVADRGKDILIKANVPGFDQKDINIEVSEDNVVISGKYEEKENEERYVLKERPQKVVFERIIPLGTKTIPNKARANLKNGVLEIVIPKAEPTQKKALKIEVK